MNRSKMDRQVTLIAVTNSRDTSGGTIEIKTDIETVFAQKDDQTGREFQAAGQTTAALTTRFWIDWRPDMGPANRLRLIGERGEPDLEYDITFSREVGRRDGIEILATARV